MLLILEFVVFVPFPFIKQGSIVYLIISKIARLGIYDNLIYSRAAILLMTCITCIGTKAKKDIEFDPERQVVLPLIGGFIITGISIWIYGWLIDWNLFSLPANFFFYMFLSIIATLTIHIALDNISKAIKHGLMKDRMNWENESFEQETKKIVNKDSINIPTLFYWKGKMRKGWINIEQPYRGIWVVGVPGSGKTFSIIEPLIRQESAKGWSMAVYDYKFPTLARKLFYQFEKNKILGKLPQHSMLLIS